MDTAKLVDSLIKANTQKYDRWESFFGKYKDISDLSSEISFDFRLVNFDFDSKIISKKSDQNLRILLKHTKLRRYFKSLMTQYDTANILKKPNFQTYKTKLKTELKLLRRLLTRNDLTNFICYLKLEKTVTGEEVVDLIEHVFKSNLKELLQQRKKFPENKKYQKLVVKEWKHLANSIHEEYLVIYSHYVLKVAK